MNDLYKPYFCGIGEMTNSEVQGQGDGGGDYDNEPQGQPQQQEGVDPSLGNSTKPGKMSPQKQRRFSDPREVFDPSTPSPSHRPKRHSGGGSFSRTSHLKRRPPTKRDRVWAEIIQKQQQIQASLVNLVSESRLNNNLLEGGGGGGPQISGNNERRNSCIFVPKSLSILNSMNNNNDNVSELQERQGDEVNNNDTPGQRTLRNDYPIPGILPEHTFILIREITSRIEVHQVRERFVEGLQFSNQFALGGASGLLAAYLVKHFGKTALTAAGGGGLILALASRKGFIEVNWNRVFQELQKRGGNFASSQESSVSTHGQDQSQGQDGNYNDSSFGPESAESSSSLSVGEDWTVEKIYKAKQWIVDHSVAAAGFASGFLYSVL